MSWHVYLVRCADGTLYCGITRDLERRLAQHNGLLSGGAIYTRSRRPVRLVGAKTVESRSEALKMESRLKKLRAENKLASLLATPA